MLKLILTRTIINYGGQFYLNNTIFSLCSSATSGGAIFVDHSSSNLFMINLAFDRCSTNELGGAMYIMQANNCYLVKSCFYKCTANQINAVLIYGSQYFVAKVNVNMTDEFCPYVNLECSVYSSSNTYCTLNNYSKSTTTYLCAGCYFSSNVNDQISTYCQVCDCKGPAFLGIWKTSKSTNSYMNFINNSVYFSWIELIEASLNPVLIGIVFKKNNITSLVRHISASGVPVFQGCSFDTANVFGTYIDHSINTFQSSKTLIPMDFLNTFYCWDNSTQYISFHLNRKSNFFANCFVIFIVNF